MKLFNDKKNCCGCTMCMNICPQKAITMLEDEEGFKYPVIDEAKCVNCGLCKKKCPLENDEKLKTNNIKVYAVKNKNEQIRLNSTSGGIFSVLAEHFLDLDGVVYGAAFDHKNVVNHQIIKNKNEIFKLRGSKYVQSELGYIFTDVKKNLELNKKVIFSGTPCQIAGLKSYLLKDYENLLLCDIVCHGVPSPKIYREYISWIKSIYGNFSSFNFRDKEISWHGANVSIITDKKKIINTNYLKTFTDIYFSDFISRPSCGNCKFTSIKRVSDITIGDFWGIKKIAPKFYDNSGVSLVLVNSEKGEKIFADIKEKLNIYESNIKECLQPQLLEPVKPNRHRENFWNYYKKKGTISALKKFSHYGLKRKILSYSKRIIKKLLHR